MLTIEKLSSILNESYPALRVPFKDGTLHPIAWDGMNEATLAHLIYHGLKQKAGDAYSTFKGIDAEKKAQALKVLDNVAKNDLRADRESDPVMVELKRIAAAKVTAARPDGMKVVDWAKSDAAKRLMEEWLANPKAKTLAEKRVAEAQELELELTE